MSDAVIEAEVDTALKAAFPKAEKIEIVNIGACEAPKLEITIISTEFDGLKRLDRHRKANTAMGDLLTSGRVHAATFKIDVPKTEATLEVS